MLRARDRNRGILMVAHVLRFWPAYCFLREVVACRAYGAIRSLSLTRKSGVPGWAPWLLRPEESGGAILDLLLHDFDQALLLFGLPESMTARTIDSPNVMECSLHYPGGVEVAIAGGWYPGDVPFAMAFELRAGGGELRSPKSGSWRDLRRPRRSAPTQMWPIPSSHIPHYAKSDVPRGTFGRVRRPRGIPIPETKRCVAKVRSTLHDARVSGRRPCAGRRRSV